jgi:hypothetical protein
MKGTAVKGEIVNNHVPFMYKFIGTWGYSPHPKRWKEFLNWHSEHSNKPPEYFDVPGILPSSWWHEFIKRKRTGSMWTQYMHYYVETVNPELFHLYVNLPDKKTISAHHREKGEHYTGGEGRDFNLAQKISLNFPSQLNKYDWDGKQIAKGVAPKLVDKQRSPDVVEQIEPVEKNRITTNPAITFYNRDDFGSILNKEKFKIGVELGVQRGLFAETTLTDWHSCERYVLVDLWKKQDNYLDVANHRDHSKFKMETMRRMEPFKKKGVNIETCQDFTSSCVGKYADSTFDYIYIDARHDFKGVYMDMEQWWPKLRVGGIMAGHDYVTQDEGPQQTGQDWTKNFDGTIDKTRTVVKGAVNKFARENNLIVNTGSGEDSGWPRKSPWPSWAVRKTSASVLPILSSSAKGNRLFEPEPTLDESLNKSIVMLTWSDRLHRFPKTALMNRLYAKRHGYRRVVTHERLQPQIHQAWEKIAVLHHMLQDPSVSVVMWLDDDAFVRKQSITIEYWLEKYPNADLIIASHDAANQGLHALNSGVMIFRNTPWSKHFLNTVLHSEDCDRKSTQCCWEQDCIQKTLNESDFEIHVAEPRLGEFNCQLIHRSYKGECKPWVWHAMGSGAKGTLEHVAEEAYTTEKKPRKATIDDF